ncbi:NAD(P)-dependent oxidoreductase [Paraburkholderia sp. RL17-347-BIC-D]|uniref:NAD(P)-dependent oxidoreductase n=1 Tax=Paraburkholderia sp. RL17-347-BIC-D TaxID=3031632 RepID=UPI0038BC20DC
MHWNGYGDRRLARPEGESLRVHADGTPALPCRSSLAANLCRPVVNGSRTTGRQKACRGFAYKFFRGIDLHHSTLGIVGMGRIGRAIARRAVGLDVNVIYHNRSRLDPKLETSYLALYHTRRTSARSRSSRE